MRAGAGMNPILAMPSPRLLAHSVSLLQAGEDDDDMVV